MSYKCTGSDKHGDCPLKDTCVRFTREADKEQKYYHKLPYSDEGRRCDFYFPTWVMDELKLIKNATSNDRTSKKRREADQ